jgi:acyl carrier protein
VKEAEGGDKRLVAYVVGADQEGPAVGELRSYLRERLPEYMTPHLFVFIDALPLNPNGKVDRSRLPQPDQDRPNLESSFVAPRNEWEETIARVFCEVLGLERVGVFDNFFDLGGHSLLATQAVSKVRKELNGDLPLRCIFETPTIADLASVVIVKSDADSEDSDRIMSINRSDQGLDELMLRINELSDEEVAALLGK